jgi:hypothetical protein
MKCFLVLVSALLISLSSVASFTAITANEFRDQHDQVQKLDASTKWILFAPDKESFAFAKVGFEKLEIKNAKDKNGFLVSDISGMPTFVTKMFALPKMKKYSFVLALDRTGEGTKEWPRNKNELTLIKVDQLKVNEIIHLKSETETIEALKNLTN